jgi:hypothetical protein
MTSGVEVPASAAIDFRLVAATPSLAKRAIAASRIRARAVRTLALGHHGRQ